MPVSVGTTLGPYEILAPLGAGGMGEVYRARDTKLGREVALKVLPEVFARDAERMARFDREAQVLAALNHPNIATLYAAEELDGVRALVMELVEGPTLAERISAGLLPLEEALPVAKQMADALEYAHEKGVVHRDLKPANVKISPAGVVKVLDFGLAKALDDTPATGNIHNSPTMSLAATRMGVILGTAAYMSPEQAAGKPVDKRSDIWSFGVVLWEMLTGKRMYSGESPVEIMASVMVKDLVLDELPLDTPASVRRLLGRCLEKDPRRRLRDIGEARVVLEEPHREEPLPPPTAPQPTRVRLWMGVSAALALAMLGALAVAIGWLRPKPVDPSATRFVVTLPPGTTLPLGAAGARFAVSPDGRTLVFEAVDTGDRTYLWVRPVDSFSARRLDRTEGAHNPFWSPDGQFIAFIAEQKLKRIALSSGSLQTICDQEGEEAAGGGAWNQEGIILFTAGTGRDRRLYRVPATGGRAAPATKLDTANGELSHSHPQFLPDGKHFLYLARNQNEEKSGIYIQALGSEERKLLVNTPVRAVWAPPGHLLFVRDGALLAQRLDRNRFELQGEPARVADEVNNNEANGQGAFAVSASGVLVYRSGGGRVGRLNGQLEWYDREGKRLETSGGSSGYFQIALSPDEKRVAVERLEGASSDIWLLELGSGVFSRLTVGTAAWEGDPVWSPDSQRIIVAVNNNSKRELREINVASGATNVLYADDKEKHPDDWSRDGRFLIYHEGNGQVVRLLPLSGERKPQTILETPFVKSQFHFSPDGRWVAYHSRESGRDEVYVASLPSFAEKRQISTGGGVQPRWRSDGKELFYRTTQGVMTVEVKAGTRIETGAPRTLFLLPMRMAVSVYSRNQYSVAAGGTKFLMHEPVRNPEQTNNQLNVVVNWAPGLPP